MKSKSFKRQSQLKLLKDDLAKVRSSFESDELQSMLLQIELMLSEIDLFQNDEELENVDPIETLQGNLIGILNPAEPAKWHAVLSLFILNKIQELNLKNNSKLVELAFKSLNLSKNYSEQAEQRSKTEARQRSKDGTDANTKKYELLNVLKEAAFKEYEPAIRLIQLKNQTAAAKVIITYTSIAKIVYPKVEHLNRDKRGRRVIGRNTKTKPVQSLAQVFEVAVAKKELKSPMYYRKELLS
jgi:hypothetical protein